MDLHAIEPLKNADFELDPNKPMLVVPTQVDDDDQVVPLGDEIPVLVDKKVVLLRLKPITALFSGNVKPPSFSQGPTQDYVMFFAAIERVVADTASLMRPIPTDREFERLYRLLKRHPDGKDKNPLFGYMQAAVRAYMSLVDVSRDEFEAVVSRIALTAKHFSSGPSTTNYFEMLSKMFLGNPDPVFTLTATR
jgi:hypothetical protein